MAAVNTTQNTNISSAQSFANGAFTQANNAASFANSAFNMANNSVITLTSNSQTQITTNNTLGNIVFGLAATGVTAGSYAYYTNWQVDSFGRMTSTTASTILEPMGNSAYAFANTGYTQANNAASFANGSFTQANSAASFANSAYAFTNTSIYSITANTNGGLFANGTQGVTQTGNVLISVSNTHITNAVTANTTMGLQVAAFTIGSGANTIVFTPTTTNSVGGIALNMAGNVAFGISKTVSSPSSANRIDLQVGGLQNILSGPRWSGLHFNTPDTIVSNAITGFPRAFTFWEYDATTNPTYLNFNIVTGNSGGVSGGANSNMNLGTLEAGYTSILTSGTERMRITSTGGVSFGSSGTAFGTSGQVLTSNGDAPPTWNVITSTSTLIQANTNGALFANGTQGVSQTGTVLLSLANTAVTAGTYGGTTQIPVITVDGSGRATYAANVSFSGGATITDDTTTGATRYPLFADATSGTLSTVYTDSTGLTFNPSTSTLSAGIFTSLSDENQKTNIKPIQNALNIVENIKGVTFDWKESDLPSAGLIAQDVEKYLPQLIENVDDKKTLNYNGVIGILVEAIKELNEKVKQLENKE